MMKRRIIVINRVLQFRYAGVIIAAMIFAVALIFISTLHYINLNKELFASIPGSQDLVFGLAKFYAIVMIFYVTTVVVFSLYASHKFAGPLYRFQQTFKTIAEGDLSTKVVLREKDELMEMRDDLNIMIAGIRTRVKQEKERSKLALTFLNEIKTLIAQPLTQEKVEDVNTLIGKIESKLNEVGTQFKL